MMAVRRRHPGEPARPRRRPRLVVRARAGHRVRPDHGARVAPREMLAEARLVDGLVVDAGVDLERAELLEMLDEGGLACDQLSVLAHACRRVEVNTDPAR